MKSDILKKVKSKKSKKKKELNFRKKKKFKCHLLFQSALIKKH